MVSVCSGQGPPLLQKIIVWSPLVKPCSSSWGVSISTFPALCCISSQASSSPGTMSPPLLALCPHNHTLHLPITTCSPLPDLSSKALLGDFHLLSLASSLPHIPSTQELLSSHWDFQSTEPPPFCSLYLLLAPPSSLPSLASKALHYLCHILTPVRNPLPVSLQIRSKWKRNFMSPPSSHLKLRLVLCLSSYSFSRTHSLLALLLPVSSFLPYFLCFISPHLPEL